MYVQIIWKIKKWKKEEKQNYPLRAHIRTWLASASRFMQCSHKIHEIICFIFHVSQKYGLAAPIFAQNHYTEGLYCWNWKTEKKKNTKRILLLNCKKKKNMTEMMIESNHCGKTLCTLVKWNVVLTRPIQMHPTIYTHRI